MAPLLLAGFGLFFVLVVVRVAGADVVPDSIGLALYAYGLWRVAAGSRLLVVASTLAGIAGVVGLVGIAPDALPEAVAAVLLATYNIVVSLALTLGALGLSRRTVDEAGSRSTQFRVVALLSGAGLMAFVLGWAVNSTDHGAALTILSVGQLVTVVTLVWYAVLLMLTSDIHVQASSRAKTPSPPEREGVSSRAGVRPERR
ncbi:MAG: hypothetical protein ACRDO2_13740 [Nocardioidaceae bacterium]